MSKTKNYLGLVSIWKINSLFKEFKCSLSTMVDFAVTKYFLKSNQKKKINKSYKTLTLKSPWNCVLFHGKAFAISYLVLSKKNADSQVERKAGKKRTLCSLRGEGAKEVELLLESTSLMTFSSCLYSDIHNINKPQRQIN